LHNIGKSDMPFCISVGSLNINPINIFQEDTVRQII
jgi:hypothetical protein